MSRYTDLRQISDNLLHLSARLDQRPVIRTSRPGTQRAWVKIVGGNTLDENGQAGIEAVQVASVPTAYDPTVTSSFIDGIGRGTLTLDGVTQADYVLINNRTVDVLIADDKITCGTVIYMPVDAGGHVMVWPVT